MNIHTKLPEFKELRVIYLFFMYFGGSLLLVLGILRLIKVQAVYASEQSNTKVLLIAGGVILLVIARITQIKTKKKV